MLVSSPFGVVRFVCLFVLRIRLFVCFGFVAFYKFVLCIWLLFLRWALYKKGASGSLSLLQL